MPVTATYVVPLVETVTQYKDHTVTERVPAGCEEIVPGRVWSTLKIGGGVVILGTSTPLDTLPKGAQQLSASKDERLTAQTVSKLSNAIGENLDTTRHRDLSTLLLDLLVLDADGEKRKPLAPRKTADGSEQRIYLANELVVAQKIPAGGAEITDNFNRGSLGAGWTATAWYSGAPVEILDSIELGTTAPIGSDNYAGRHLTALSSADHYVQADSTVEASGNRHWGLMLRMDDNDSPSSGYQGGIDIAPGEFGFWEVDNGYGRTQIASAATFSGTTIATLRLEANGSSLELFWGGASKLTTTDATYTDLYVGAWFRVNTDDVRWDNFEASALGGGGGDATVNATLMAIGPPSFPSRAVGAGVGASAVSRSFSMFSPGVRAGVGATALTRSLSVNAPGVGSGVGASALSRSVAINTAGVAGGVGPAPLAGVGTFPTGGVGAGVGAGALAATVTFPSPQVGSESSAQIDAETLTASVTFNTAGVGGGVGAQALSRAVTINTAGVAAGVSAQPFATVTTLIGPGIGTEVSAATFTSTIQALSPGVSAGVGALVLQALASFPAPTVGDGDTSDPNPITLTIRDRGHTVTIADNTHTITVRDRTHTATLRENR